MEVLTGKAHTWSLDKLPWFSKNEVPEFFSIIDVQKIRLERIADTPIIPGTERYAFGQALLKGNGLMYIEGHGVSEQIIQKICDVTRKTLLEEGNSKYVSPELRGVTPFADENHGYAVGKGNVPDLCSKYTWGEGGNISPNEEFQKIWDEYFRETKELALELLTTVGEVMKLSFHQSKAYKEAINGHGLLRYLHYKGGISDQSGGDDSERLANHTDLGLFTILYQTPSMDSHISLQAKVGSEFVGVPAVRNTFIVNAGETLSYLFDRKVKAAEHRVILPPPGLRDERCERTAIAMFLDPDKNSKIKPSEIYDSIQDLEREEVTFGEFFGNVESHVRNLPKKIGKPKELVFE